MKALQLTCLAMVFFCSLTASAQVPLPGFSLVDDMFLPDEVVYGDSNFTATAWTGGIVPYVFDANVSTLNRVRAENAMAEWAAVANVQFVPRTNQANYVTFRDSSGNNSYVGMIGGSQTINMYNWNWKYIICHEIKHALGYLHEQSRPDRDTYVTIHLANICCSAGGNFNITNSATAVGAYDFYSIMHYGETAFSTGSAPTITANPGYTQFQSAMGNRNYMTDLDALGVASRYGAALPPVITQLAPGSLSAQGSTTTVTITGLRFFEGSGSSSGVQGTRAYWNGAPLPTTYLSPTQIEVTISSTLLSSSGCPVITVENPYPGGGVSSGVTLPVGATCSGLADYQLNSAQASLTLSGVQAQGPFGPAAVTAYVPGESIDLLATSSLPSTFFDAAIVLAPLLPASTSGFVTNGGQIINLAVGSHPITYLSTGSSTFSLMPMVGPVALSFSAPSSPLVISTQMLVIDASHADGIRLSQGCQADVVTNMTVLAGTPVTLSDDSSVAVALGFGYSFAGTVFTEIHIGSNGYVTFGGGDTDYSPTIGEFLSGEPRLSPFWTDMNPAAGGTVTFGSHAGGVWAVNFQGVRLFGTTQTNTFSILAGGDRVRFEYGALASTSGLAGVTQGGNQGSGLPLDLSASSGLVFGQSASPYQLFSNNNDLNGQTLVIGLDSSGYPVRFY
jgi:hypothetical protein